MTVYNCGPIYYYTVCRSCLKFSLHCAKLTVPYRTMLFVFALYVFFFNLDLNFIAATAFCFSTKVFFFFLRENGTFRFNVLNFTTYN